MTSGVTANEDLNLGSGTLDAVSLDVGGTEIVSSTRRFYASDGTSVKAAYSFNGDSATGMIHPGSSQIGFITGGAGERARVTNDGIEVRKR